MEKIFVGIDVSKAKFDVCEYGNNRILTFNNNQDGYKKFISHFKDSVNNLYTVVEATGGYEAKLLSALNGKSIWTHRGDSKLIYNYLRSLNKYSKTDSIDAKGLAQYIKERHNDLKPYNKPNENTKNLTDLSNRLSQLKQMLTQEKNRLKSPDNDSMKSDIDKHIEFLEGQIKALTEKMNKIISDDKDLTEKSKCLQEIKGIGETVSSLLLALLPELGTVNRGQIASLCGVAPYPKDSGTINGARTTQGGRHDVRKMLFFAALSAAKYDEKLSAFYKKLLSNGKKKLVALMAVMRKIIVIANSKIKKLLSTKETVTL